MAKEKAQTAPERKFSRRKILKIAGGMALTALVGIPSLRIALKEKPTVLKPGVVHFEFGEHETAEQAEERLSPYLSLENRPDHVILEPMAFDPRMRELSENEYVKLTRDMLDVQHGRITPEQWFQRHGKPFIENPYAERRSELLGDANKRGKIIKITYEYPPDEYAREMHRTLNVSYKPNEAVLQGKLADALYFQRVTLRHMANSNFEREKSLIKQIQKLRAQDLDAKILVELGSEHEHVHDVLKAQGIATTKRVTSKFLPFAQNDYVQAINKARHGIAPEPTPEKMEELEKRNLLFHMLNTSHRATTQQASDISTKITKPELEQLFTTLAKPGESLTDRTIEWLKQRGKI